MADIKAEAARDRFNEKKGVMGRRTPDEVFEALVKDNPNERDRNLLRFNVEVYQLIPPNMPIGMTTLRERIKASPKHRKMQEAHRLAIAAVNDLVRTGSVSRFWDKNGEVLYVRGKDKPPGLLTAEELERLQKKGSDQ